MHCIYTGNSIQNIADLIRYCSRSQGRIKEKYFLFVGEFFNKPQPNLHSGDISIQETIAVVPGVSPESRFHGNNFLQNRQNRHALAFPHRARVALTVLCSSVGAARKVSTNWSQQTMIFILPIKLFKYCLESGKRPIGDFFSKHLLPA